jgi:hypothetical protein
LIKNYWHSWFPRLPGIGLCAAKKSRFDGVRLHLIAQRRVGHLPLPAQVWLWSGAHHDSQAFIQQQPELPSTELFGDLAYPTPQTISHLRDEEQARLIAPRKKPKGKELADDEKYYNRLVRRIRQPVESLFNWVEEKTGMQRASKVRSTDALMIHCWGKLAVAFLLLVFNY